MRTLLIGFLISVAVDVLSGLLSDLLLHRMTTVLTPPAPTPYYWSPAAPGQPQGTVKEAQQ